MTADRQTTRLLAWLIAGYAAAYVALAAAGLQVFIFKTMLVPAFLLYALRQARPRELASDWLPFLGATVLFDALRGAIYALVEADVRPVFFTYVIEIDAWLLGVPSICTTVQEALRTPVLDRLMVLVHGTHFVYFLFVGLVVWQARRSSFWQYRRVMLGVMGGGLAGYLVVPTAPPWMAGQGSMLPPVAHVTAEVYTAVPALHAAFDTNPVAAMPSLHVAFPIACAMVLWRLFGRRVGALAWAYVLLVAFAAVYLGEHYVIDLMAGGALSAAAFGLVGWPYSRRSAHRLRAAVVTSVVLVLLAVLAILATRPG